MPINLIEDIKYSSEIRGISPHVHNCYEIIFLKEGSLNIKINGTDYSPNAPSLIFVSKLEQHSLKVEGNDYVRYYLCISPDGADTYIRDYLLLSLLSNRPKNFCHVLNIDGYEAEIEQIFIRLASEFESQSPYKNLMQSSLLTELLIKIYRIAPSLFSSESNKSISVIWNVQQKLEKQLNEKITLSSLSEEYHINQYYLSHLFKKITGYSIMQYLNMCRLASARQLLADTQLSVTEIVYNTGFTDCSNFSKVFKRETGYSPLDYRKKEQK